MKIAENVEMLEISATIAGRPSAIHPTLFHDGDSGVLVDAGFPGQAELLREAIEKTGLAFNKVTRIVLTHQDIDHIGSAQALKDLLGKVEISASEGDKPYIEGKLHSIKMTPEAISRMLANLPPEVPEANREAMRKTFENPPKVAVDRVLKENEILPWFGGLVVIPTPGHTPGHLSLYHTASKTLVAGDSMTVTDGQLQCSLARVSSDHASAQKSISRFLPFDIAAVICYHGGVYRGKVNERIKEIASEAAN